MTHRLVITLHLDAFACVVQGAWTLFDSEDARLACEVLADFRPEMLIEDAAGLVGARAYGWSRTQLSLF